MKKKLLAILLTICMFVTMAPTAFAEDGKVAEVNGTEFETLQAAINAANDGDTVTLLTDVTVSSTVQINKAIILNGDSHEINGTASPLLKLNSGKSITVQNVTLRTTGNVVRWNYVNSPCIHTYENCKISGGVYGIHYDGGSGKVVIEGCTIDGFNAFGSALEQVTIKDTTFDADQSGYAGANLWGYSVVENVTLVDEGKTTWLDPKSTAEITGGKVVKDGVESPLESYVDAHAKVGTTYYTDLQEAIKAAAPAGTVEILQDVTVDEWIMFSQRLSIGSGQIITISIDGLTINGNGHTLTVKSIESAGNGNRLFYDATNLNIKDLTIKCVDSAANQGGIGLSSGKLENITFDGGVYGVLPGEGNITINGCTFKTKSAGIYNEEERDNLVVTNNRFETGADTYTIFLRGDTTFTGNTIVTGKVRVVSGSPVIKDNDFGNMNVKVSNSATALFENNKINNLEFSDDTEVGSTFIDNILSDAAAAALANANATNVKTPYQILIKNPYTGINELYMELGYREAFPQNIPAPFKAGFEFIGWANEFPETMPEHDVVLIPLYRQTYFQIDTPVKPVTPVTPVTPVVPSEPEVDDDSCDGKLSSGCAAATFADLDTSAWYHDAVDYVLENGLMQGVGGGKFAPYTTTSRAMIVTILYRLEGEPAVTGANPFADVENDEWYTDAVLWAAENEIVLGYDGEFFPTDDVTLEQVLLILQRYAEYKGADEITVPMLAPYEYSTWAEAGVVWAYLNDILEIGTDLDDLTAPATRAELAGLLYAFCK